MKKLANSNNTYTIETITFFRNDRIETVFLKAYFRLQKDSKSEREFG